MNGYELTNMWYDFAADNPEKIKVKHHALFNYCVHLCNKLGWKEKFRLPTEHTKHILSITNQRTYSSALNELVEWGLIDMVQRSTNQHTANFISLHTKSYRQCTKQGTKQRTSNVLSDVYALPSAVHTQCIVSATIDKPLINYNKLLHTNVLKKTNYKKESFNKEAAINKSFIPPTIEQMMDYCDERGHFRLIGEKAYHYYTQLNWKDKTGTPVKNWKIKMNVWFKPENKVKPRKFIQ